MSDPDTAFHRASAHDLSSSGMTAWAMIETMKRLWNYVVPLIDRKRSAGITGGCQKKPTVVAAMHWPESADAVDRLVGEMGTFQWRAADRDCGSRCGRY